MIGNIDKHVSKRTSELAALMLWDAEAIMVNLDEPFKLVSGNYSPIYVNCRRVISDPTFMSMFTAIAQLIWKREGIQVNVIAGGETAGIPFAAYLARSLSIPMVYVRKSKKVHGIASLVEGRLAKNAKVLLVEDLITDGKSKMGFIDALSDAGATVEHALVLFDRLQGGSEALQRRGVLLHKLTDMDTALGVAEIEKLLPNGHVEAVRVYIVSPRDWHIKRGLPFN
jgi:orotate phosphoribosyltransferase